MLPPFSFLLLDMALLVFFLLFLLTLCDSHCPKSFPCQNFRPLEYPLTQFDQPDCGLIRIDCTSSVPIFRIEDEEYKVLEIFTDKFMVRDTVLEHNLNTNGCLSFSATHLPISPPDKIVTFTISPNLTLFKCKKPLSERKDVIEYFENYKSHSDCDGFTVYYRNPADGNLTIWEMDLPSGCSLIQLPMNPTANWRNTDDVFKLLTYEYTIQWYVEPTEGKKNTLILAAAISGGTFFLVCLLACFIIWRKKRVTNVYRLPRNISSDHSSSKTDIEGGGSLLFGIPVFSYTELVEATNNFDPSGELGDGGFGTVYYGKLGDGREVAIKRLYEHNYRRVEQFMNEIKILTCLKHPNLVTLYGCTSRRSRELLLVYEYVVNGTVADHLHGERTEESPLTWSVRMSIAIETATALTYLHKSDIIHRDVKTNNILLTQNFCVKVADFGLSRLFPNDVTHISTAPQGTPGYVDPEYHQCYQLTGKSDVYSFGVVLVELISSMPAVDINRHRHEINLANLALNKIQKSAFDELIDSSLGYGTDVEITRMTTSVAELAFRCLQPEKDMRPSMDEVLDYLKDIQSGDSLMFEKVNVENGNGKMLHSPETDEAMLLKKKNLLSPVAVTDKWTSSSSTIESSIE